MLYVSDGIEMEITEDTINTIVDELLTQSERPTQELVKESEDSLRLAAHKFLAVLQFEKQNIAKFEQVLDAKKNWEKSWIKENAEKYNNTSDVKSALRSNPAYQNYNAQIRELKKSAYMQESIKNIYKAGMAFQDTINKSINQEPILTFVSSKGNNVGIYKIPLREAFVRNLLKVDISSDGGITMRFGGTYATLEKYANTVDSQIERLQTDRGIENKPILDKTYNEVMRRFNRYKIATPKSKVVSVVLWKHAGDWMKMLPSAKGDINEAYANYYIQGLMESKDETAKDLTDKGSIDENIHSFMSLVAEVDNARGRLLGDISVALSNGGSLDYAIKSAGASVLSFNSLVEMAEAVIKASNGKIRNTMKEMRSTDEEQKVFRNVATKLTKDDLVIEVSKTVKKEINAFEKGFSIS